ncbi:MAG: response regulator [Methylacidiphilales bacterium]|nr:response regulator [Candidatus Methylacidiphilales bacterium]
MPQEQELEISKARKIIHDLNNNLMAIRGHIYLALLEAPKESKLRLHLEQIHEAVQSAISISAEMEGTPSSSHEPIPDPPETPPAKAKGTILIAEDDAMMRDMLKFTLEKTGYTVLTASDGEVAVNLYRQSAADIQLVLLDLTMPKLNGIEAFTEMKRINPKATGLLISGFPEREINQQARDNGFAGYIHKPCSLGDMLAVIHGAIPDSPSAT